MSPNSRTTQSEEWPVIGHEWAVRLLQRALPAAGTIPYDSRLSHAYLILGARHAGKSTLARALAHTLLCTESDSAPCGKCRACRLMAQGNHPDFRLIQPLSREGKPDREGGLLRAEQASDIIRDASIRPLESAYKIFLIQDIQRANESFANKLLKSIEEPPDYVIYCLTATDRGNVLPTIRSRCQILELRPLDTATIETALAERWAVEPEQARLLARLSGGRLGWAVEQLQEESMREQRVETLATLLHLVEADRVERLLYAETLARKRDNQHLFGLLEIWTIWWRDVLLIQSGCPEGCSNVDRLTDVERVAGQISAARVSDYLTTLRRIGGYLQHTVNTRLALEVLVLQMPMIGHH
ncbi:MAG: DNA polymerase III subunit [Caldilineaceae bacterium]|nr:DNA polymerase III subunit [Caldilineaceae bacterium]